MYDLLCEHILRQAGLLCFTRSLTGKTYLQSRMFTVYDVHIVTVVVSLVEVLSFYEDFPEFSCFYFDILLKHFLFLVSLLSGDLGSHGRSSTVNLSVLVLVVLVVLVLTVAAVLVKGQRTEGSSSKAL